MVKKVLNLIAQLGETAGNIYEKFGFSFSLDYGNNTDWNCCVFIRYIIFELPYDKDTASIHYENYCLSL